MGVGVRIHGASEVRDLLPPKVLAEDPEEE